MIGLGDLLKVPDALEKTIDVIERLASKLKADPDAAATKLADALGEIEKTCRALDDALKKYLQLAFDPRPENADLLLEIGGGGLIVTVEGGRGHCHEIWNIYHHYLDRWFDRVFKQDTQERNELRNVFSTLGDADRDLFKQMVKLAKEAQRQANVVLDHLSNNQPNEAKAELRASIKRFQPIRVKMNELMARLLTLKAQFIEIARVPPASGDR
jgi:hypothetical protein